MGPESLKDQQKVSTKTFKKTVSKAPGAPGEPGAFTLDYDKALQSESMISLKPKYDLFIDGEFRTPQSKKYFDSVNPAKGTLLCKVAQADKKDVDLAVKSATKAFEGAWAQTSPAERGACLFRVARILQERAREFAVLETLDGGKPIRESRDVDLPLAAAHFFYYAGWADKLNYLPSSWPLKPVGVCAQVIPWNFPLLMAAWKLAPALACGNTVVLKPAETTPLTALFLAEVIREAGIPEGVVNILTGDGTTGAALVSHPQVRKVAFTGSTQVGKEIARICGIHGKKLTLELGGKSANIIFEDAAIDQAIEGIIQGIYFNQGHVCCAGSRLLVEESVADDVLRRLKSRVELLRVGDPLDKNTDVGAINSKEQLDRIQSLIRTGCREGGRFWQSGAELPETGFYQAPCLFSDVSPSHTICRTEIFGPVLSVMTFRSPEEAVEKANDTPYGLAAGIWSEKASKIQKVSKQLKAGVIWSNTYHQFDPSSPFGGYRESGWGREGGVHGLTPYLEKN